MYKRPSSVQGNIKALLCFLDQSRRFMKVFRTAFACYERTTDVFFCLGVTNSRKEKHMMKKVLNHFKDF